MASWIEVGDVPARKLLAAYFAKVDRALAPLSREEADAVRLELETHILDAMAGTPASEADAKAALEQLGDPDDFIPQLVADRLRARAGRTFGPLSLTGQTLHGTDAQGQSRVEAYLNGTQVPLTSIDISLTTPNTTFDYARALHSMVNTSAAMKKPQH